MNKARKPPDRASRHPVLLLLPLFIAFAASARAQVLSLEDIPAEVADHNAAAELRVEHSRLQTYLRGLQRVGEIFNAECRGVRRHSAAWHSCVARKTDLEAKRRAYNADVEQFNARVAELRRRERARVQEVRDPALVEGGTATALAAANRKTNFVLDALRFGATDWNASIGYLRDLLSRSPQDQDLRDALAYIEGMYRGHLMAKDLSNRYYRYGVRRWLAGDFTAAARAFAQAARDDPDDLAVYRSFAHAVGRQHGSPDCQADGLCVSDQLPRWASFFGPEHDVAMAALETEVRRDPRARRLRHMLNMLQGMAVYTVGAPAPPAWNPRAHALANQALARQRSGDSLGAARLFFQAWQASDEDRALLYLGEYSEGMAAAGGHADAVPPINLLIEEMQDKWLDEAWKRLAAAPAEKDRSGARQALAALEAAMREAARNSPFFGTLGRGEIAQLGGQ